jgi:hypothetical protein
MNLEQQRAVAMANARMRAAQAGDTGTPAAQPEKSFGDKLGEVWGGLSLTPYQVVQSIIQAGARGTDALGLTNGAGDTIHQIYKEDNERFTPGLAEGSKYTKAGNISGQVLSTLPLMSLKVAQGASLLPTIANAATQGGAAGFMFSDGDPIGGTAGGALGGGLLGGTLSVAGRGLAKLAAPALPPAAKALNYVRNIMGDAGIGPAELRAVAATGKPITSAEAIGKPGEVAMGALARRDGLTADALASEMAVRSAGAPDRILADYATAAGIHPSAAMGDLETFVAANKDKATPLYKDAFEANQSIGSPEIDRILATPAGRKALKSASELMQNDQSLMGVANPDLLEQAREAGQEIPWTGGVASGLKLRSLDYVKRALDDQIRTAFRSGANTEAGILTGLKGRLVKALDAADVTGSAGPNSVKAAGGKYAQARAAAGDYLSAQEQFTKGQSLILNPKVTAKEMAAHLSELGGADAQAFKGGVANKLFTMAQNGRLDPKVFAASSVQQKLEAVLGQAKTQQFIANMQRESEMAAFARKRVPGAGSPTAEYRDAMAVQDAGATQLPIDLLKAGVTTVTHGPVPAATGFLQKRLGDIAARYQTAGMPVTVRDAAGDLLLSPPATLADALDTAAAQPYGLLSPFGQRRGIFADNLRGYVNQIAPRAGIFEPILYPADSTK